MPQFRLTHFLLMSLVLLHTSNARAEIVRDLIAEEGIEQSSGDVNGIKLSEGESSGFFERIFKIFSKDSPKGNIVIYKYDPEVTYQVNLKTSVSTIVNLPENEKITFYSSGDSTLFKITYNKDIPNLISIKTLSNDAESNLVLKTDLGSIYNFYLSSRLPNEMEEGLKDEKTPNLPNFTIYVVKDKEQEEMAREQILLRDLKAGNDYIKKVKSLDKLNTSYKIKGDKEIAPIFVYDDGKWTYFDFGKKFVSDRLPNVYKVVDQFDAVINTRVEGNLLIAQSLSVDGWTLKNGDKFVCIRPKKSLYEVYHDERLK
jgi:type IV secretory pathway VirB9-like protein